MFRFEQGEGFPGREERVLKFWQEKGIFEKSVEKGREGIFRFYDGPPFATGLPHYGHLLAGTIKDVVPRYKTMKGYPGREALRLGLPRVAHRKRDRKGEGTVGRRGHRGVRDRSVQ
jgi:hypothetical protein